MNIFALHLSPKQAAQWHADKHVVKMVVEAIQMLYSAHWVAAYPFLLKNRSAIAISRAQKLLPLPPSLKYLGGGAPFQKKDPTNRGFRPVHLHHPCTIWVRSSRANYNWLCQLALELVKEHMIRWPSNPEVLCKKHAIWLSTYIPPLPSIPLTPFAKAMPEEYRRNDPIQSYRAFYSGSKQERGITNRYTNRQPPPWL
jgi:hypothetical protein